MNWPHKLKLQRSERIVGGLSTASQVLKYASSSGLSAQYVSFGAGRHCIATIVAQYDNDLNRLEVFECTDKSFEGTLATVVYDNDIDAYDDKKHIDEGERECETMNEAFD